MSHFFNEIIDNAIEAIFYNHNIENAHKALEDLKKIASEGDADAMYLVARCYAGKDFCWKYFEFPENNVLVNKYLKESIINGSAIGVIGSMRAGALTEELERKMPFSSIKEAWNQVYEKAQNGNAFCQNMIGNSYYWLDIVHINNIDPNKYEDEESWKQFLNKMMKRSIPWYEKAFKNGMSFAGRNLITIYEKGEEGIIEPEPHKALEVEKLGASLGYPEWKEKYGTRLIETDEDEKKGVELCRVAAEEGQKIGWYEVARAYQRGKAYPIDYKKSLQAAENGIGCMDDFNCCEIAAELYLGDYVGVEKNYERAVYLLERAKQQGSEYVITRLAFCYLLGLGCKKDVEKALLLMNDIINEDEDFEDEYLNYCLGFIFSEGIQVKKNIKKAIQFWEQDADTFKPSKEAIQQYKRTWYGKWIKK